jgi:hypothetical protein
MDLLTSPVSTVEAVPEPPLEGYDEATVDGFLRAVALEQERLRSEIDAAHARETRAMALIGMHEAMLTTMRDVYVEITTTRRAAETEAAAITDEATRRAALIRSGSIRSGIVR